MQIDWTTSGGWSEELAGFPWTTRCSDLPMSIRGRWRGLPTVAVDAHSRCILAESIRRSERLGKSEVGWHLSKRLTAAWGLDH